MGDYEKAEQLIAGLSRAEKARLLHRSHRDEIERQIADNEAASNA